MGQKRNAYRILENRHLKGWEGNWKRTLKLM
jgi:hypothetical protein